MNKYLKFLWITAPLILAIVLTLFIFGLDAFSENKIDINIHDTYYVFSTLNIIMTLTISLCVIIYTGWFLHRKFKNNKTANLLFLILMSMSVVGFSLLMILNHQYTTPDFSSNELGYDYPITSNCNMAIIQFLLIVSTVYLSYKAGQKFKTTKNEN